MTRPVPTIKKKIGSWGYIEIYVGKGVNHRNPKVSYAYEHVLIAERALGKPISADHPVHHFNEDKTDNRNSNLVICESKAYHALLHVRTKIWKLGGDPNIEKICSTCKRILPLSSFSKHHRRYDGLQNNCKHCMSIALAVYRGRVSNVSDI